MTTAPTPRSPHSAPVPPVPRRSRAGLRRTLGSLVLRDAVRAYGVGVSLALLPLVYLAREWPPWAIREALHGLPPSSRALVMAGLHATYGLATAPLVRQLLASERLRWWWGLPLSAGWWRALHLRHLVLMNAPWLAAIVYGAIPLAARDGPIEAVLTALTFAGLTFCGQIAIATTADRPVVWAVAAGLGWAGAVATAVLIPTPAGAALMALALTAAIRRLGRPLPEAGARARGRAGGPPVLALARLGWLAVRRHDAVALAWGTAVQLGAVALVGLGIVHVGTEQPHAVAALRRGLALVCAVVGTALVLRSARVLHGDRPLLDTWGIAPPHERWARLLLAAAGVLPALVAGSLVLPWLGPTGRAWPLDLLCATAWAAPWTVQIGFSQEAARRLDRPRLPRHLLWLGGTLVLVGIAGTPLVLLPWAAVELARLPGVQRRADHVRRRFETAARDDHRS